MSYTLKLTPIAIEDIEFHKKSGDKATLKKLSVLLDELTEHPKTGTGKPEEMKYNFPGCLVKTNKQETQTCLSNR